jgi:phosphoglycolate phosphatase
MTPRSILFDWSGTLVDDLPPVLDATNTVLQHFGRPVMSREEFRRSFRLPFKGYYEEHLPGVTLAELDPIWHRAFHGSREPVSLIPHARDYLEACAARGLRLFVLSSAPQQAVEKQARDLGLAHFFERIHAGVHDKREHISPILAQHGLEPAHTIMIGDMRHDIETARAGGIRSVAVLTGYEYPEVIATAEPDLMVDDLSHLLTLHFS